MESKGNTRMTAEYKEFLTKLSGTETVRSFTRRVVLNGARMASAEKSHKYIAHKLSFPSYYGNNLDALYDILSTLSEPTEIMIKKIKKMHILLGEYADALIKVFIDSEKTNKNIWLIQKD